MRDDTHGRRAIHVPLPRETVELVLRREAEPWEYDLGAGGKRLHVPLPIRCAVEVRIATLENAGGRALPGAARELAFDRVPDLRMAQDRVGAAGRAIRERDLEVRIAVDVEGLGRRPSQ